MTTLLLNKIHCKLKLIKIMKAFLSDERTDHQDSPEWWLTFIVYFLGFWIMEEIAEVHPLGASVKTFPGKHNWREKAYPECVWNHLMGWGPWQTQWYKRKMASKSRHSLLSASSLLWNKPVLSTPSFCPAVMCLTLWNFLEKYNIFPWVVILPSVILS